MKRTKWLVLLGLIVLAYVGWRYRCNHEEAQIAAARSEDPGLLLNRVWVDSKPVKLTDYVQALLVVDYVPVGVFQKASAYRFLVERFEYNRDGRSLKVRFPQTNRSDRLTYRIRSCKDLPPYDLCLELSRNPWEGPRRYFAMREQKQEPPDVAALRDALQAHVK